MKRLGLFFSDLIRNYIEDEMSVYAAQASFFTLLAAFPFFMLLLALIELIPLVHESDLLAFLVELMPDNLDTLIVSVLENISSVSPLAILSASAVVSLWSASKGMLSIERGLNRAYNVQVQRNYFVRRLVCSGYTFLFTVMCAISLLFRFSAFFILLLLILAFYVVLPYKKQPILWQLPGALFSALGWALFSVAFSAYFHYWGRFAITYGSLTAVIFLMLWLYFCICILFLGAEINDRISTFQNT
ncbi:MAG: YihY/virulence factor BrkB family protein [Lachnospiraceae bacterium]|nr:YihY/virulence factor BrkB family protein [Lachnospiraceae bacterium]